MSKNVTKAIQYTDQYFKAQDTFLLLEHLPLKNQKLRKLPVFTQKKFARPLNIF